MENASKALIIAGEILIAMLILSVGTYLIMNMQRVTEAYESEMTEQEITKFNTFFLHYDERKNITPQEIASVVNYAQEFNYSSEEKRITVSVLGTPEFTDEPTVSKEVINDRLVKFISANTYKMEGDQIKFEDEKPVLKYYRCELHYITEGVNKSLIDRVTFYEM